MVMTASAKIPMPTISTPPPPVGTAAVGNVENTSGTSLVLGGRVEGAPVAEFDVDVDVGSAGGDVDGRLLGGRLCPPGGSGFTGGRCVVSPSTPAEVGAAEVGTVWDGVGAGLLRVRLGTSVDVSEVWSVGDGVPAGERVGQRGGVGVSDGVGGSDEVGASEVAGSAGDSSEIGEPDSVGAGQVGDGLVDVGESGEVGAPDAVDESDVVGSEGVVESAGTSPH